MKKLLCLVSVPDKYTKGVEYKEGTYYDFDDEKVLKRSNKTRAEEVLSARTPVTKEPYFIEVEELNGHDDPIGPEGTSALEILEEVIEEKPTKRNRKKKEDN